MPPDGTFFGDLTGVPTFFISSILTLAAACSSSSFTGDAPTKKQAQQKPESEPEPEPEERVSKTCSSEKKELKPKISISFVLDASTSMFLTLQNLKNDVAQFVVNNQERYDAKYSLSVFVDSIKQNTGYLDARDVANKVLRVGLIDDGNTDFPEGAMGAVLANQEKMTDDSRRPFYIILTDDLMHMGGTESNTSNRDCSVKTFADEMAPNAKVIAWGSTSKTQTTCGGYESTKEQFAALKEESENFIFKGAWFDSKALLYEIPTVIEKYVETCEE